jgi:hypothetical protein
MAIANLTPAQGAVLLAPFGRADGRAGGTAYARQPIKRNELASLLAQLEHTPIAAAGTLQARVDARSPVACCS